MAEQLDVVPLGLPDGGIPVIGHVFRGTIGDNPDPGVDEFFPEIVADERGCLPGNIESDHKLPILECLRHDFPNGFPEVGSSLVHGNAY